MEKTKEIYLFNIFDGEGGEGAEGGGEASTQLEEPAPRVEYGKGAEGGANNSQVGSDTNGGNDLEAEFAELIGKDGKFHDLYGKAVSNAIQDRFKNQTDYKGQVGMYEQATASLMQKYGLKAGDIEGLAEAIENDEDIYRSGAEEQGIDVKQYMYNLKLKAEAEEGRRIKANYENAQKQSMMQQQWEADSRELQTAFPNFNLNAEMRSNPDFTKLLDNGVSVRDAFFATHSGEILAGFADVTGKQAQSSVVNKIKQNASRPTESGIKHAPSVVRKADPSTLSDADMEEIDRRVDSGEVIHF